MENAQEHKRRRFECLLIEHHVRLRSFVRSMGVDPDWVDDVAQEAFLTAYRDWAAFDEGRDFGRWVRGIAANIIRNEIRKDVRRQRILRSELTEILLRRDAGLPDHAEPLAIEAIRECVGRLAPASREVVMGRYRDGESASELALRLGTTAANVRQMLVRIRRGIKRCVELRMLKEA